MKKWLILLVLCLNIVFGKDVEIKFPEYYKQIEAMGLLYGEGTLKEVEHMRKWISDRTASKIILPNEEQLINTAHAYFNTERNLQKCVTVMFESSKMFYTHLLIPETNKKDMSYVRDEYRYYINQRYIVWLTEACAMGVTSWTLAQVGEIRDLTETEMRRLKNQQEIERLKEEAVRRGF